MQPYGVTLTDKNVLKNGNSIDCQRCKKAATQIVRLSNSALVRAPVKERNESYDTKAAAHKTL
jgi:hypothetical protein